MGHRRLRPRKVRLQTRIRHPLPTRITIKLPDAAPEIVFACALSDGQALLAKIRHNRLIDIFLGIAAFSLQNRTTVLDTLKEPNTFYLSQIHMASPSKRR